MVSYTVRTQNGLSPCGSLIRLLYVDSDECVFCVLGPLLIHVMLVALTFTLLVCAHIEIQSNIVVVFLQSDWLCIGIAPLVLSVFKSPFYTVLWYISTGSITVLLLSIFDLWHSFSFSQYYTCKSVHGFLHNIHYTSIASLDVEMMCVICCTLLYDHIVINVNVPGG